MTPAQLQTLKTELALPAYAGKSDEEAETLLNARVKQVDRESVSGGLIAGVIVRSEFAALTAGDKQYVQLLCTCPSIDMTATLKTELGGVFGAGTATRAAMIAAIKRSGSRAEELGLGGVTTSNVADAKRS